MTVILSSCHLVAQFMKLDLRRPRRYYERVNKVINGSATVRCMISKTITEPIEGSTRLVIGPIAIPIRISDASTRKSVFATRRRKKRVRGNCRFAYAAKQLHNTRMEIDHVFKALADPTRRQLLDQLFARNGQTLQELCAELDMARQSVSKHLTILETAGLITIEWRGREKLHYLNPLPIQEIYDRWIGKYERSRMQALSALKQSLENPDRNT